MTATQPTSWTHHLVPPDPSNPDVKIHYVDCPPDASHIYTTSSGEPGRTILLIHGFPQTWYEFRHLIPRLTALGLRVIAVDYRGAGASTKPIGGYDKMTMGRDLGLLMRDHLKVERYLVLGHDIGSMVAVGLTLQFRDNVQGLMIMEGPSPGTKAYDRITRDDKFTYGPLYHWFFHAQADVPEMLTHGKEREYITSFYNRLSYNPEFYTKEDLDVYAHAYTQFGALRAGFDTYRAFRQDRVDFQEHMKKNEKLKMPVLAAAGDACFFAE